MMKRVRASRGFTLVELLIVIVVIAILAAITIVAYGNVTSKAQAAALQSDLTQAKTFLDSYFVTNGSYPADLPAAETAGLKVSSSDTLNYVVNNAVNPATYALTASNGSQSYYINNTTQTSPKSGEWVQNLALNPGFDGTANSWSGFWSVSTSLDTTNYHSGTGSMIITQNDSGNGHSDGVSLSSAPFPAVVAGATYQASFWFKAATGTYVIASYATSSGYTGVAAVSVAGTGTWKQVVLPNYVATSGNTTSSPPLVLRIIMSAASSTTPSPVAAGTTVNIDDVIEVVTPPGMAVPNSVNYADGNTSGWAWDGTPDASTSEGPAL